MTRDKVNQIQAFQNPMVTKDYGSRNKVQGSASERQNDDFQKVLNSKKDEGSSRRKSRIDSKRASEQEPKKSIEKQENEANENEEIDNVKEETVDEAVVSEEIVHEEVTDEELANQELINEVLASEEAINGVAVNQVTSNELAINPQSIDEGAIAQKVSELKASIEELIQTLQLSNTIDVEKLEVLVENFEKSNLNPDELQDILHNLEVISQEIIDGKTSEEISEKLLHVTELLEGIKQTLVESTINPKTHNNFNAEAINGDETMESENVDVKSIMGKESENQKEGLLQDSKEDSSLQGNEQLSFKKSLKNDLSGPKDLEGEKNVDFLNIKDFHIREFKGHELTRAHTTLVDIQKPADIFNQIVEGTKVSITEDVSEMVLKLKPDNLGKLSMKIVLERGMLVAKFEVESQIVKEAIESNLEDLRNALSDKGFEVQQMDVSVNKDSQDKGSQFSYFNREKGKKISISNNFERNDTYSSNLHNMTGLSSTINYLG